MSDYIKEYDMPIGWFWATIEEIIDGRNGVFKDGDWVETKDQNPNGVVRLIQLADVGDGFFRNRSDRFMTKEKALEINCTFLKNGDILVARMPDPLGRACIFPFKEENKYVTVVDVAIIRTELNGVSNKLLLNFINSPIIRKEIERLQTGTTRKRISRGNLSTIKFPIPPLNEQHRIVSKIEELFSELDNGVANLKLAQNQLKVYRQALLKHAFEGKLTEQWRNENNPEPAEKLLECIKEERQKRYEQELKEWKAAIKAWEKDGKKEQRPSRPSKPIVPEKPNDVHESKKWELPEGWDWTQLGLVTFITKLAGFEYTKYVNYDEDGDLSVIKAENAGPNGFKRTDYSRIKSETVSNLKRSQLSGGELLVVFVGAGTGNVAVVPKNSNFFLGPNIGMARPYGNIDSKYFEFFYQSPMGKDMLMVTAKAVAQPSLSMGTIRQTPLAIPSIDEQNLIIQILESQFSVVDNLEKTIESGLQKSEALHQSILKKAFEGKLVPQDPNDEPASELLKRIQAEKKKYLEEQKQQKKRKPKNTKKMSKELSIEEVLKASDKPMLAKDVWQKSKHKENIEDFYKELKDIQSKIKEVKKGTESLLSLAK
ncbi:restriction endonuclease subunit S [uncultured Cyclobacterium sp.]|uniref:restriction endonuclease subunit S n=1 Tax=uncultured Cyclobacterium sp. TaxID=453820 RepID=UPI0030ED2871|tara:strand:- start:32140 stop:33933 length:1794 start_codon:yes stop_codon:yes gene_type:complete